MKRAILLIAAAVLALDAAAIAATRQDELLTVTPPSMDAAPPAAEAEIVTGVCTFGDCPVVVAKNATTSHDLAKTSQDSASYQQVVGKLQESEEPETELITAPEPVTMAPEAPEEPVWQGGRTVTCWVTAYCGCESCSEGWGSMTATGGYARPNHTIAVDPSVIPYGTKVEINGITYTAEDCGDAVNGYEIDVFFAEHWQTEAWPTGYYNVTIY